MSFPRRENSPDVLKQVSSNVFGRRGWERSVRRSALGCPGEATPGRKVTGVCAPPATWSIPQKMQFFSTTLVVAGLRRKISALLAWLQTFEGLVIIGSGPPPLSSQRSCCFPFLSYPDCSWITGHSPETQPPTSGSWNELHVEGCQFRRRTRDILVWERWEYKALDVIEYDPRVPR